MTPTAKGIARRKPGNSLYSFYHLTIRQSVTALKRCNPPLYRFSLEYSPYLLPGGYGA